MEKVIGLIFRCPYCGEVCVYHDDPYSLHKCSECGTKMEFLNEIKQDDLGSDS